MYLIFDSSTDIQTLDLVPHHQFPQNIDHKAVSKSIYYTHRCGNVSGETRDEYRYNVYGRF